MVCGKPLYFFKITVVSLHFHCLSAVCICSADTLSLGTLYEFHSRLHCELTQVSSYNACAFSTIFMGNSSWHFSTYIY